ncbi:MAG: sigma-70 family RNA polymerase sigma factor [Pseudomonadota bacterium]
MQPDESAVAQQRDAHVPHDERALMAAIARQDRRALEALYRSYYTRLFRFAFRMTHSHDAADEIVNDVMLAVWRGAGGFRGSSKVSTWIFGIAYRQSLKRLSRKSLTVAADFDLDEVAAGDDHSAEDRDWVRHGVDALPAAQKLAIVLVFYIGMSYEEVAEVTDCPVNTVKTRMFHARRKLKGLLKEAAS